MTLGLRLRTLRERATMGQAEVAAALDVSIPTVSEWESGKKRPRRSRIEALSKLFNVTADYLLFGTSPMMPDHNSDAEEKCLLTLYRHADPQVQMAVMTLLRAAAEKDTP